MSRPTIPMGVDMQALELRDRIAVELDEAEALAARGLHANAVRAVDRASAYRSWLEYLPECSP